MDRLSGRKRVRLGILLAILSAVVAIALVRVWSSTGANAGSALPPPTHKQVQLVSAWLRELRIPSGLRSDVTQTACPSGLLCVTASDTPSQLISILAAALASHGASMGRRECVALPPQPADAPAVPEDPVCVRVGSYRGVAISVLSGRRNALTQPSSWASIEVRYESSGIPKRAPLPSIGFLASLGAVPPDWHVAMRCTVHVASGCFEYMGRVTLRGSACGAISQFMRALERSNFDVDIVVRDAAVGRCSVGASRKLEPGGGDWFVLDATLGDQTEHTSKGAIWITSM